MLNGLFFTAPYYLLISVPLLLGLLYAYRQKSNKNYKKVSTLFLFEKLRSRSLIAQKIKLPWRFLAELLAFILLLLALAGLGMPAKASKIAVIIDNSLSMSAQNGAKSLLESAKAAAIAGLASLPADAQVAVYNSSIEKFVSVAEARNQINAIKINSTASFEQKTKNAAEAGIYHEIYAYSDSIPDGSGGHPSIFYKNVKAGPLKNLAISNARWETPGNISLEIVNFSNAVANYEIQLELYSVSGDSLSSVQIIEQRGAATERSNAKFSSVPSADLYRVRLRSADPQADLVSADSEYFLLPGVKNSGQVLCYSAYQYKDLELNKFFPELNDCQSPNDYKAETLNNSKLVLLLGFIPSVLPKANTLLVANSSKSQTANIINWRTDSDLLKYLKPGDLKFNTSEIPAPAYFQNEITAANAAVLASAEISGARYVYSSTQLFPFTGDRSRALSILTLNIYSWLKAEQRDDNKISSADILASKDNKLIKQVKSAEIYRYVNADKSMVHNEFSLTESDTFNEHFIILPQYFNAAAEQSSAKNLSTKLLLLAILLLLGIQIIWDLFLRLKK